MSVARAETYSDGIWEREGSSSLSSWIPSGHAERLEVKEGEEIWGMVSSCLSKRSLSYAVGLYSFQQSLQN